MSERDMVETLMETVTDSDSEDVQSMTTFEDGGVMTRNQGFTMRMADGSEFQVTVVQSRQARDGE